MIFIQRIWFDFENPLSNPIYHPFRAYQKQQNISIVKTYSHFDLHTKTSLQLNPTQFFINLRF